NPIFLRGTCLHEENPLIPGKPRSKGDLKMLLEWAKELNCNFVRLAHYPHNEYMSQLADEMGLMLWEEVPVYWDIDWTNDTTFNNAKNQLSELITRDKNRASVIVWSIGNETPTNDAREKFMESLAGHADAETRFSEDFQEAIYQNQLKLLTTIDGLRGTCPWILVDFRSPKRLNDVYQSGWNRKGLYTETGKKKKAFFVVKSFYDDL